MPGQGAVISQIPLNPPMPAFGRKKITKGGDPNSSPF